MSAHVIDTSDGEKMVALRTLPAGLPADKLPMVLLVHGGPWARDHWGWNAQVTSLVRVSVYARLCVCECVCVCVCVVCVYALSLAAHFCNLV
jgi:pimeloyl-ACP methyl ester carboxylesterase